MLAAPNRISARGMQLFIAVLPLAAAGRAEEISTRTLLDELTDLAALAEFPDPPFTCKQFSSFDRASKGPDDPKAWFANDDTNQYLRVEEKEQRKEYVMMDAEGPGVVVRMWSANPAGTLRIYLDGAETPVIECPMTEWLGGGYNGVPKPIAGEYSKGWNSYFPIAYARHCKITSDKNGFYYHINYRTYPPDTPVASFEVEDLRASAREIFRSAAQLAWPRMGPRRPDFKAEPYGVVIAPRQEVVLGEWAGAMALREFTAKLTGPPDAAALRNLLLTMTFDNETTIAAPLGDFFGSAPGLKPFESLPAGIAGDGEMWCGWVMPFGTSARIVVRNFGDEPVNLVGSLAVTPYRWSERSLHFHAKWRSQRQVPTRPMIDWNYLSCTGQGVFAGAAFSIANPVRQWWGEGDEKIYVDGEAFPSHFGTGTEDYFGYAWCWPVPFTHAYHAQPRCDGPGNYGHTSVNRWHVLDRIPFTRSFKFDMELWHWNDAAAVDMAVVAYWYARPGGRDEFARILADDLKFTELPPYEPFRVAGAIEGESLKILEQTGKAEPQFIEGCSNDQHLWWREGGKPGGKLVLALPVPAPGRYRVFIRCLKARDYGRVQFSLAGKRVGEPRDYYDDSIKLDDEADLGEFALPAGDCPLEIEIVGANEKSKGHLFGLDYVRLEASP